MGYRRPSPLIACILFYAGVYLAVFVHYYPNRTDPPQAIHFQPTPEEQSFYNAAFDAQQARYEVIARENADVCHVQERVADFVKRYRLSGAHVLDVGSGEGRLQDAVADYTGLDISASVRPYYHKRFIQADARAMPFPDNEFDAVWTIWVLEHIPNPEQALREIRRVLKPAGLVLMHPAWLVSDLNADGYPVRPYSDFGIGGKLIKATVPLQRAAAFRALYMLPTRALRLADWKMHGGPTALHYRALTPNYQNYWMPDSDAVNSIDMFEVYLWFRSRGDECVDCPPESELMHTAYTPLVFRVNKRSLPATQTANSAP